MRNSGTYELEELVSDIDGSTAYRIADPDTAGSWERAKRVPSADIQWTCEDDDESDDLEISITATALAILVSRAGSHCPGCPGECGR